MSNKINIAIDGPSGSGKSSTARALAKKLGMNYLDTGQMYRGITWYWQNKLKSDIELLEAEIHNISIEYKELDTRREILINGFAPGDNLYEKSIVDKVSFIAKQQFVREYLVEAQQKIALSKGYILDGRDIGTVVLPESELKIFLVAPSEIRAKRRQEELLAKGIEQNFDDILANLIERDRIDSSREHSPLKKHEDAIEINTGEFNFDEQVSEIYKLAKNAINAL